MKRKFISAILVIMMLTMTIPAFVFAAEEYSFEYIGVVAPSSVTHNVTNAYRHNGDSGSYAVHYYGYTRSPITLTDEPFTSAYRYMCYGTGDTRADYGKNAFMFTLANSFSNVAAGDILYFSGYYKSASSFISEDGNSTQFVGVDTRPTVMIKDNSTAMYELSSGAATTSGNNASFKADDKWHRFEYYIPLTQAIIDAGDFTPRFCFMEMGKACRIDVAGFNLGLLKLGSSVEKVNDAYYTYLGYALNRAELKSAGIQNGNSIPLEEGKLEYNVVADSITDILTATGVTGAKTAEVNKIDSFNYEITAYAPGYDDVDTSERTYSEKADENGDFSTTGTVKTYTASNTDRTAVYKIKLDVKPVAVKIFVNNTEGNNLSACAEDDVVKVKATFNNFFDKEYTYMTMLVIYKDGAISKLVPYKTVLAANELNRVDNFTYTLPEGDYTGASCDVFVINTENYSDVLK